MVHVLTPEAVDSIVKGVIKLSLPVLFLERRKNNK
jgi:hypothetical protein